MDKIEQLPISTVSPVSSTSPQSQLSSSEPTKPIPIPPSTRSSSYGLCKKAPAFFFSPEDEQLAKKNYQAKSLLSEEITRNGVKKQVQPPHRGDMSINTCDKDQADEEVMFEMEM